MFPNRYSVSGFEVLFSVNLSLAPQANGSQNKSSVAFSVLLKMLEVAQ